MFIFDVILKQLLVSFLLRIVLSYNPFLPEMGWGVGEGWVASLFAEADLNNCLDSLVTLNPLSIINHPLTNIGQVFQASVNQLVGSIIRSVFRPFLQNFLLYMELCEFYSFEKLVFCHVLFCEFGLDWLIGWKRP